MGEQVEKGSHWTQPAAENPAQQDSQKYRDERQKQRQFDRAARNDHHKRDERIYVEKKVFGKIVMERVWHFEEKDKEQEQEKALYIRPQTYCQWTGSFLFLHCILTKY